jgi:hypothetical protein
MRIKMKLYNLTHEGKQYVSSYKPTHLPEEDFSYIEITYNEEKIEKIIGIYNFDGYETESILQDIDIKTYLDKLGKKTIPDKISLNFVENEENSNLKIFIISLSSYLIYFDFLDLPFETSFDLFNNEMIRYFINMSPNNFIEKSWIEQVKYFYKCFFFILEDEVENTDTNKNYIDEYIDESINKGIEKINEEVFRLVKEVKEFKKKMLSDMKIDKQKEIK